MATVLIVSKPLSPPWNDGSKNLARDVADGMLRHTPRVITTESARWRPRRGAVAVTQRAAAGFSPGLAEQVRVLAHLALGPRVDLWHFFFAPNAKSSGAARVLQRLRRTPTVHTVCSRPRDPSRAGRVLFADRTVVLSRATQRAFAEVGIEVDRIAPCAPALPVPTEDERNDARARLGLPLDAPIVVFPGDLEHGEGATRMLDAHARGRSDAVLVMACRTKTAGAKRAERRLRDRDRPRVVWLGETPHIHALLGAADVVALPSSDLYAKVDLPLVLLEALRLARPVVVAADAPAAEIADGGAAIAVEADVEALSHAIDGLFDDDEARRAQGERACVAARERYDARVMVAAYEALYDDLLGGRR